MKKITTSISTFKKLIHADYLYVDKTRIIYEMVREPYGQYFFSRPRRFGKSLTVSTLETIFNGEKECFKGLYIYDTDYSWEKYPVIHLDFGRSDCTTKKNLESWLNTELRGYAKRHDLTITGASPAILFGELIKGLYYKYSKEVVILIDEYDRPITNNLEDDRRLKEIRVMMEAFYQVIKGYESMERFVFLTGITKLSQVSIFSKLNNLADISHNVTYARLTGYTQEELDTCFGEAISEAADTHHCSEEQIRDRIRRWYDGFRFTADETKLYNPVSVGKFFSEHYVFGNYWYATATPVMLVRLARQTGLSVEDISEAVYTETSYNSFDVSELANENIGVQQLLQLLFQTGYLTLGARMDNSQTPMWQLVYPNLEVQMSFEKELAGIYTDQGIQEINNVAENVQKAAYV